MWQQNSWCDTDRFLILTCLTFSILTPGFNDLKSELTDYLKEFADQGKVVKREDIDKFFEDMQARKRQRIGGSGAAVQYLCR